MVTPFTPPPASSVSPEQFIALNDEIAAMIRAGVPLEMGLHELGDDATGALSRMSSQLADRMSLGESLSEAMRSEHRSLPRAYSAVIDAGLRGGRLSAALESVSAFMWEFIDFRRKITLAAIYPLIVVALAYLLFLLFLVEYANRIRATFETFRLPPSALVTWIVTVSENRAVWAWIPPALLLATIVWQLVARGRNRWVFRLPFVGTQHFQCAMFADLLAMQVEHGVPLPEGIVLSADATGSPAMRQSARKLADHIAQGGSLSEMPEGRRDFPPFLRWLMVDGHRQGNLAHSLRLASEMYRRRATNSLDAFMRLFPVFVSLVIGGGVVLMYSLGTFVPFTQLLRGLAG